MKHHLHQLGWELQNGKNNWLKDIPRKVLPAVLILLLLAIIPLFFSARVPLVLWGGLRDDTVSLHCDIFKGEWVPDPKAPYYTNTSCWAIHDHQNCMKYGRPDSAYLKWKWKPDDCRLPEFDPARFFDLMRGKSLAFVGDSVGRNHMQSLICLLSRVLILFFQHIQVEYPEDASKGGDEKYRRWYYTSYDFTIQAMWTEFLVKGKQTDQHGPTNTGLFSLYLDEPDEQWVSKLQGFDYVILSVGHWFQRPLLYYERGELVGCQFCPGANMTDLGKEYGYRRAFRTAFRAINGLQNFKGITYLRTFAPSHFENGQWNKGGHCLRGKPFKSNETSLGGTDMEFYRAQLEEFREAEEEGKKRGLKFRLLDITRAMLMRPDGHPGIYGHRLEENVTLYNDCVHWCLPGPIDAWSDFFLQMLRMEKSYYSS
ncbi:trichome birefringence-like 19 protein [Nymphaea thermarum]|nr:trichome birefringence-like 19 protein [Nymphaea thermarum]